MRWSMCVPRCDRALEAIPQALDIRAMRIEEPVGHRHEIAPEQIDGDVSFFGKRCAKRTFASATDAQGRGLTSREKSNAAVIAALKSYGAWMKTDLLPRSNGDFRLGADTFAKKLAYDEMVDLPLTAAGNRAWTICTRTRRSLRGWRRRSIPTKTPQEELKELQGMHPAPDQLLNTFHETFDSADRVYRAHHIITIPCDVQPTLEDTPPFMRATTFASMDPPGPFETHSKKAYFNVTLPEKDWTPAAYRGVHGAVQRRDDCLAPACTRRIPATTCSSCGCRSSPSKIRKVLGANTNIEGWAHYCEQMMLDEGYGAARRGSRRTWRGEADPAGAAAGCAAARRAVRGRSSCTRARAGMQWTMAGRGLLREGRLPDARRSAEVETKRGTRTRPISTTRWANWRS